MIKGYFRVVLVGLGGLGLLFWPISCAVNPVSGRRELMLLSDIVDNANSGTNLATTVEAARYARSISGKAAITLVIGQSEGDGAVCEGFALDHIRAAIDRIRPLCVIGVGAFLMPGTPEFEGLTPLISAYTTTFTEAYTLALRMTDNGSIVLAVKTWR